MSESNRYYAVELASLSSALRGDSLRFNQAIPSGLLEGTRHALQTLREEHSFAWDLAPMRDQRWDVFAELSHVVANAVRIDGEEIGWDAWFGRQRLLIPVLDWNPLVRGFGSKWVCRPLPPIFFARRHLLPLAQQTAYTESWPHGFFLRSEYRTIIPGLHTLIHDAWQQLHEDSDVAVASIRPGQPMPKSLIDELGGEEEVNLTWQTQRAMRLYNALCVAAAKDRDLFSLGY